MNKENKNKQTEEEKIIDNQEVKQEEVKDVKVKEVKPKKVKVDYKAEFKKAQEEITRLNLKIKELVIDNNKNIDAFQSKAQGFQSKAQEEINKVKNELREKAEADASETKKYGAQRLLENILDPINNIDVAIAAGEKQNDPSVNAYVQGFKMLMGQLFSELEAYGITIIVPEVGDVYDPELHQAFSTDGEGSDKISQVKKKGYKLHDRVIKPAIVVVSK